MLYRTMPVSDDELSILGYGCMRFPTRGGKIDRAQAIPMLRAAIDEGVNYLDTGWNYHGGESEPFLAEALTDGYRARVRVATKLPQWLVKTRADMDRFLDSQIQRLGGDPIEYYLMHAIDGGTWDRLCELGARDFLQGALTDGRIGSAGFSYHGDREDFGRIVDDWDWGFCQVQYNILDENLGAGREGVRHAAQRGMGVIVMEPLRGGYLASAPPPVQAIWDEADVERSPAEWALRWVWDQPEVTLVLSGMGEGPHIAENLRIASEVTPNSLTGHDLELVSRAAQAYRDLQRVACTSCSYCMPCPAGVDIPGCFEMFNMTRVKAQGRNAQFEYALRLGGLLGTGGSTYASRCVGCGKCEEHCPQRLPIRELLVDVKRELEGPKLKLMTPVARLFLAFERWRSLRGTPRTGVRD